MANPDTKRKQSEKCSILGKDHAQQEENILEDVMANDRQYISFEVDTVPGNALMTGKNKSAKILSSGTNELRDPDADRATATESLVDSTMNHITIGCDVSAPKRNSTTGTCILVES